MKRRRPRKIVSLLASFCMCLALALAGCGRDEGPASQEINTEEEQLEGGRQETETQEGELQGAQEQSFDVDLGGSWGQVTFTSYGPNTSVYSTQDVSFALVKDGSVVYEFPDVMDGNFRSHETFLNILAVSFQDYSGDGEKDVIVICEYAPLITTASGGTLKEVRLYRNLGDSFQLDRGKMDWLQVNDYCNTIDQVMEHVKEAAADE